MKNKIKASEAGLKLVNRARQAKQWNKYYNAVAWQQAALVSEAKLQRFWAKKEIPEEDFIAICKAVGIENWQDIVDQNQTEEIIDINKRNWFAYDQAWVGRENTVKELLAKLESNCRLLLLIGITGIGKTALAECLADNLLGETKGNWIGFQQVNCEHGQLFSNPKNIFIDWLRSWGYPLSLEEHRDPNSLIHALVNFLDNNPCLIILDSLENLLAGDENEGWSQFKDPIWETFFTQFLALNNPKSRIILTTQDLPQQIERRYKNFWQCQYVTGLNENEQLALFDKLGLDVRENSPNTPYLTRIGKAYEGHPLALRILAGEIGESFYGDVVAFWQKYGQEIIVVEEALAKAKEGFVVGEDLFKLQSFLRELRLSLETRLIKTFDRLENEVNPAYKLLCETSIYREEVPETFWLTNLERMKLDTETQEMILQVLKDRSLVDVSYKEGYCYLRQHNLIRSISLARLRSLKSC
jgi:DNA polymerase III delta prime subunit